MKALAAFCCMAALACGMAACKDNSGAGANTTAAPDTHDADVRTISDDEAQWNKDYAAKDLGKIAGHYADDAVLMAPGMESLHGKDAIRKGLQEMIADPALVLQFHASRTDVSKSGDLAYTQGAYTMKMTDPHTHKVMDDRGSYVTTYRKQADGSWKAVADIATSEMPAMPAPAKKM